MGRPIALAKKLSIIFVWGIMMANAAPSPGAVAEGSISGAKAAVLESEIGSKLTGEEAKIRLEIPEVPTALGPATLEFGGVILSAGKPCSTAGAAEGTVVVPGEFHVVWTSLAPLEVGVLFLFSEVVAKCHEGGKETIKVKVKQPILAHVNAVLNEHILSFGVTAKCSGKGKQAVSSYYNDEEKLVTKQLPSVSFGLGFENGCEAFEKEVVLNTSSAIEIKTAVGLPSIEVFV